MTVVAMVPARRGSRGLPGKNTRMLAGKPMIAHTIDAAHEAGLRVVVNTDCMECKQVAEDMRVSWYERPPELGSDDATMRDVVRDFVTNAAMHDPLRPSGVAVLYPTYPLRTAQDIRRMVEHFEAEGRPIIGVKEPAAHPFMMVEADEHGIVRPVMPHNRNRYYRRQDYPLVWQLTHFACVLPIPLPADLDAQLMSHRTALHVVTGDALDVDTYDDFEQAERIMGRSKECSL